SGIYSVAAFDFANGTKLWEIDHQLLIGRPNHGVLYASRSVGDEAVLERVDLATGSESPIYKEQLPAELTMAARQREQEKWEALHQRSEAAKERRLTQEREAAEKTEREHARKEICLRFDNSGMLDVREYWILHPGGEAEYIDAGRNFSLFRTKG